MFGYIQANLSALQEEEKERYKAFYCGLCHALGKRYGFQSRLSLSYDLTFMAMLLSSLYEPDEEIKNSRCVVHPCKRHAYVSNPYIDYAADMSVALMYFKCIDDWNDDRKLSRKAYASLLSKAYQTVKAFWPQQYTVIEDELEAISEIEQRRDTSSDAAANHFGKLMAELFVMKTDHWSSYLRSFGFYLGKYIYLADAAVDLEHDKKTGSYNPLADLSIGSEDLRGALKAILGRASEAFEVLPLIQDSAVSFIRELHYFFIAKNVVKPWLVSFQFRIPLYHYQMIKENAGMNKLIAVLISVTTAIAILLLTIAALLIWKPGILISLLHIVIIAACIIAGICMLIPLFIAVVVVVSSRKHGKQEKTDH